MYNSPVKTTARYLPGSPCYSMASETGEGKEETVEVQEPEEVPQTEEKAVLKKPASKQSKAEAKAKAKSKVDAKAAKTKEAGNFVQIISVG